MADKIWPQLKPKPLNKLTMSRNSGENKVYLQSSHYKQSIKWGKMAGFYNGPSILQKTVLIHI